MNSKCLSMAKKHKKNHRKGKIPQDRNGCIPAEIGGKIPKEVGNGDDEVENIIGATR